MNINQVQRIADVLNKDMSKDHGSMEPTDNEVSIAYLLCHINDLERDLAISINQRLTFNKATTKRLQNLLNLFQGENQHEKTNTN